MLFLIPAGFLALAALIVWALFRWPDIGADYGEGEN